ncbi:MAG: glucose-6-phosphate isomerase, partial [Calditrichaeota bacterium]
MQDLASNQIVQRIWTHDHTVWQPEPTEIDNRLGWLHSIETMRPKLSELQAFAEAIRAEGYTQALLLGMGGSSLAPEVFRVVFGVESGFLDLAVLDSTDPGAVLEFAERFEPAQTLFIVSTKSGGTVETLSFFKFFYNLALEKLGGEEVGKHFVAITDPGSKLEAIAAERGFRRCFLNDPNIGGRFSVLSYFGLVPAALLGLDLARLLDRGQKMAERCKFENPAENPGARLGAIMGEAAARGRDKLTLVASPALAHFGAWVEQLIAESTGKEGKGILPVDGETL